MSSAIWNELRTNVAGAFEPPPTVNFPETLRSMKFGLGLYIFDPSAVSDGVSPDTARLLTSRV